VSLFAILACLVAQYAWSLRERQPLLALYGRLALSTSKRLNAGDRNSGILAWFAVMLAVLVPVGLVSTLAAAVHPALLWLIEVAFLYATVRFLHTTMELAGLEKALREGDVGAAANRLSLWRGEPVDTDDAGAITRLAAEHALREAHHATFGPLFWYLVLPGPLGLVLYPLALRAARTWEHSVEPDERDFGWFAARAFHVIDWVPQRVTAFAFAVVGNFEDALYCWRSQAAQWLSRRKASCSRAARARSACGSGSRCRAQVRSWCARRWGWASPHARMRSRASRDCCGARSSSG